MKFSCVSTTFFLFLSLLTTHLYARDHLIYSVAEEIPMGFKGDSTKRNYYINMGANQGLKSGTTLNVYRSISKLNPYDNQKRVNYKVEIGKLQVIHADDESAITIIKILNDGLKTPLFEINNFMIGDHVAVSTN